MNWRNGLFLYPLFSLSLVFSACADGLLLEEPAVRPSEQTIAEPLLPPAARSVQLTSTQPVSVLSNRLEPIQIDSIPRDVVPLLPEEAVELNYYWLLSNRLEEDEGEEDGGLPTDDVEFEFDQFDFSPAEETLPVDAPSNALISSFVIVQVDWSWLALWLASDQDGDCLTNGEELTLGTAVDRPDTDGDGWLDGACNERRRLVLTYIKAHDEQEDVGDDEFYLVVDDVRFPNGDRDLDDYWNFDDGQSRSYNLVVAERVRGTNRNGYLRSAHFEGWEDDVELWDTWTVDDLLFSFDVNVGAYTNGQTFTVRKSYSDWDYEFRFRMDIQYFADPTPLVNSDSDHDGLLDSAEFAVARDFGGITDPYRRNVLVEVDWMSGHGLTTQSKRMVTTQYYRYGYNLYIHRHQAVPKDGCLTRDQARAIYNNYFTFKSYNAFRYAVMGEELWNDASGVALGDTFFVDDSTWWINGGVLAQAGTFIHELGHTMSLTQAHTYYQIDTIGSIYYDSCMNYLYQPTRVDYSYNGAGGSSNDHNDWEDVDPTYGLKYSFGLSTYSDNGICN
ncbi:MAG: hypothetical protein JW797_00915 [Bradymonadales bacterium]|nr:hypothetical protein [Bradymonadales bacterium]